MKTNTFATAALLSASVNASVQTVQVGKSGLIFSPDSITASSGDVVEFVIHTTHNVARSSFASPCQPISGAQSIWSGDGLKDGTIFSVTVNNTDPIWLYCATGQHCEEGMAMVINPPSGGDTLSAYMAAASSVTNSGSPTAVAGGVYGAASGSAGSAGSSSASASSSSASSMTSSMSASGSSMTSTASRSSMTSMSSMSSGSGASSTSASAMTSSTHNAASNLMADAMMVGGVMLGGAVMLM